MRKYWVRLVSALMVLCMAVCLLPPQVFGTEFTCEDYASCTADGGKIYEIIKEGCPIRLQPHKHGEVAARGHKGQFISVKRVFKTKKRTQWVELNARSDGSSLYLYIENCKPHKHTMARLYDTKNGSVEACTSCGYIQAYATGRTSCDISCIADQAFKGVYSEYDPSFAGIVAQILVGEIPYVGTLADFRDLIGDIQADASAINISLDMAALIPIVGALKYSKYLDNVKYADELSDMTRHASKIPWGTWDDYEKIVENGQEFVKLGSYKYTRHAVAEFMNPSYMMNFDSHSRGIIPSYVDWVLTEGKKNGTTVLVSEWLDETGTPMRKYLNGTLEILEKNGDTVITCIPKDAKDAAAMMEKALANR